jgi:transcription elongation factor Elf1
MILFLCPRCKQSMQAPESCAGIGLDCGNCGQRMQVPLAPGSPPSNAPPIRKIPLRFSCPACNAALSAPPDCAGRTTKCRQCGQPLVVPSPPSPLPSVPVLTQPVLAQPAPVIPPLASLPQIEPVHPLVRSGHQPGRGTAAGQCPNCGSTYPPLMKKKISPVGWVVFASVLAMGLGMCVVGICFWPLLIIAFVCVPMSVLGLLLTEEDVVCPQCRFKFH